MKKIILIILLLPAVAVAQKEVKPSVSKAETALQKGLLDEAKSIIDATVANQEYMVDKKGQPSKNAAKAWYLKGLIYAAIDTSKAEKFKSLNVDFASVKEAFGKSEEIDKGKTVSFVTRMEQGIPLPMTKDQVSRTLAQAFLTRGFKTYQAKEYKTAFLDVEKVIYLLPTDTTQLLNAGVYFAPNANEDDKAIDYINRYLAAGGKEKNAFLMLYNIYYSKRKDYESALKVAKLLTEKYPDDVDYLNMEYNIYTLMNRLPEAKALMEKRAGADPKDRESRYFLGLICNEMKDIDGSRHWMLEAVKVDPDYFEPNLVLAKLTYFDAVKVRNERNAINGTRPDDLKKRQELFLKIPVKLKESLPYWEKCASLNSSDQATMDGLLNVYSDLSSYDESYQTKLTELKKKMKALGLEVD